MNKLTIGIISALALTGTMPAKAQFKLVNPVPQNIQSTGFAQLPQSVNIKTSNNRGNSFAVAALKNSLTANPKAKFTITLGIKGDKCVKAYAKHLPRKAEGYWLSINDKGAVIIGNDEEGLFYGVQTLLGSIAKGKLETGTVTDWPDVDFRGTVEGFYGTPWSHKARLSQIAFYGRNKMNTYIYGPKDDPYHRDQWRKPYPTDEANRIKELNKVSKQNGVNFYWAIHPGVDIKWNNEDRDNLINKLEMMYALGILERTFKNSLTAAANYNHTWRNYTLGVNLNGRFQSATYYPGYENAPGYGVINLNTTHTFTIGKMFKLVPSIGIDNIFNKTDHRTDTPLQKVALYSPGRMLVVGLKVNFAK